MARTATWSVKDFELCEAGILAEWRDLADDRDRASHAMASLSRATPLDEKSVLKAIVLGVLTLELHGRNAQLKSSDAKRLYDDTFLLLKSNGVHPATSRLSFVYSRLVKAVGHELSRKGDNLGAACRIEIARHLTYRATEEQSFGDCMEAAVLQLRLGHASLALANCSAAATLAKNPSDRDRATVLQVRALRLSGAADEARAKLASLSGRDDEETAWEVFALELADPERAAAAANRIFRSKGTSLVTLTSTKLWLAAGKNRAARQTAPKTVSLRRRPNLEGTDEFAAKSLSNASQTFDDAYDDAIPLPRRLESVSDACSQRSTLPSVEAELLVLAAARRHARFYGQAELADLYLAEYRGLCHSLSSGLKLDLLGVGDHDERVLSERSLSGIARAAKVASTVGEALAITASARMKRFLATDAERQRIAEQELASFSECLFERLSELKGGMMKVAQFLSVADGLPPQLQSTLALLRHSAIPAAPLAVAEVIRKSLGEPSVVFTEFDEHPVAVASIGQIHRAKLPGSERFVAVKVQHPGIKDSLLTDLRFLSILRPLLQRHMPATDIKGMLKELGERLAGETDFAREAAVQESFRQAFRDDPEVLIPGVHAEASSADVLTMDFIEGKRYEDFVATASQEERNRAGVTIARVFVTALVRHGIFNCDPHPGNYLFLPDGRVAFLDFGCSRQWQADFVRRFLVDVFAATLRNDFKAFRRLIEDFGYDRTSGRFDFDAHWELSRVLHGPLMEPGVRAFDASWLDRVNALHVDSPNLKTASPPPEALMLLRITFGLVNVLIDLKAEADWHALATAGLASLQEPASMAQPA